MAIWVSVPDKRTTTVISLLYKKIAGANQNYSGQESVELNSVNTDFSNPNY